MKKLLIISIVLVTAFSCKRAGEKMVDSVLDKTFQTLTTSKKKTFQEVFGKRDSLHVRESDGLWVDFPAAFYSCFLTYKANKDTILNFISSRPTTLPNISDSAFVKTDTTELFKKLRFIEAKYPDVQKQLGFFYTVRQNPNLEYYRCNKYPNAHYLAFDPATGFVYHYFEKYWD